MESKFALNPELDAARLAAEFEARGRIEVRDFLAASGAEALRAHLEERDDWRLVLNAGSNVYEMPRSAFLALGAEQRLELDRRVYAAAQSGFRYRYESIRVPDGRDERRASGSMLDRFVEFMSSAPVLQLIGKIIGHDDLQFADGQATAYSVGHFLTQHDDAVEGKGRRAAYVFGLQPGWRAEWGGLLMFHGPDGNIEEAFTPAMGALRLFRVPAAHSVSFVTPFAPQPRISVTGWLRAQPLP
jgi:hypothetical protein